MKLKPLKMQIYAKILYFEYRLIKVCFNISQIHKCGPKPIFDANYAHFMFGSLDIRYKQTTPCHGSDFIA